MCAVQFSVWFSSWLPHVNTLDTNDFVQLTFANIMKQPTTFICQQLAGDLKQRSLSLAVEAGAGAAGLMIVCLVFMLAVPLVRRVESTERSPRSMPNCCRV